MLRMNAEVEMGRASKNGTTCYTKFGGRSERIKLFSSQSDSEALILLYCLVMQILRRRDKATPPGFLLLPSSSYAPGLVLFPRLRALTHARMRSLCG